MYNLGKGVPVKQTMGGFKTFRLQRPLTFLPRYNW